MPRRRARKKAAPREPIKAKLGDENTRDTIILFADIMGASEVSNHMSPQDYFRFVRDFQRTFKKVCSKYITRWYLKEGRDYYLFAVRGDEGLLMIFPPADRDERGLGFDVDVALNIALALKRTWIMSEDNRTRIRGGRLPIDLGIGIHLGQTQIDYERRYRDKIENPTGATPEGYAINLAKRVESHSRNGRFTNIILSNSAHGAWKILADERIFIFDEQQFIQPKGISRNIAVFELKHHFLPSDWTDLQAASRRGQTLLDPKEVDTDLVKAAHDMNPTNVWLAEEYIRASMLKKYSSLSARERDRKDKLTEAFDEARNIAGRLANSTERDAGILFIQGLIEGECLDFESEQDKYEMAIKYSPGLAEAYWYKALSYSYRIDSSIGEDVDVKRSELTETQECWLKKAFENFEAAKYRSFNSAWIRFDYGCEIIRWAENGDDDPDLIRGIEEIIIAAGLLRDEVVDAIEHERYLEKVIDHSRIKALLSSGN